MAYEMKILSAHRLPDMTADYARSARERGLEVIICGAGMAAHLAGAVAAQTTLPVIGVPLTSGAPSGVDALYATVQVPSGIPVATVAIDGAANAAYLACQVLALRDKSLFRRLENAQWKNHDKILRATIPSHIMVPAGAVIRSQEDARFFRTTHVKEQNY